ncbi:MAG: ABC-F family ATP-binding cassette domain-containing protein [Actinobacteria bacterium]|nr:ABC-F family ATP-binding cassette domain-containing protein [Actinomycetota bacterium]
MHIVSVTGLSKSYEGRTLFTDVAFGVGTGDRVGVVGPNGSGKSTLLRILAGEEVPDEGEVVYNTAARTSHLEQQPRFDESAPALTVAAGGDAAVQQHEAEAILDRLGLDPAAPLSAMSGGQRRRVALARALLPPSDLLILDEPTNHLDVDTIDWLEDELRRRASGLLMVTHDRYFLERLTNRMIEIDASTSPGEVFWHEGTYSDVLEARAQREEQRARSEQRRQNLLRKEIAWLRRGPKARTSKPKFRVDQAIALQEATPEDARAQLQLGTGRRRLGNDVVEARDVTVRYGDTTVLEDASLVVGPGDRVGIVGPNGSGKTTLLRALTGAIEPDAGEVRIGTTVEFGVYEQEARVPPSERSVLDTIRDHGEHIPLANGENLPASSLAERFQFDGRLQRASVARLSGGERRRLALLHLLITAPNVLVLDEPTNDLDVDTLNILEDHLDGFTGTVIVASHDRYLLDRLTDRIVAVEPSGRLREHLDWESYRDAHTSRQAATAAAESAARRATAASTIDNKERQRRRKEIRSLEERMGKLGRRREDIDRELAVVGGDFARAGELAADRREVEGELARLEERWLELTVD